MRLLDGPRRRSSSFLHIRPTPVDGRKIWADAATADAEAVGDSVVSSDIVSTAVVGNPRKVRKWN